MFKIKNFSLEWDGVCWNLYKSVEKTGINPKTKQPAVGVRVEVKYYSRPEHALAAIRDNLIGQAEFEDVDKIIKAIEKSTSLLVAAGQEYFRKKKKGQAIEEDETSEEVQPKERKKRFINRKVAPRQTVCGRN